MARRKEIKLLTLDTETYNGLLGKLKRIAIYDGESVAYGYAFSDILPKILEYKKAGYAVHIYVHNMEFDLRKIPEVLEKDNVIWENSFIINGKIATLACKDYIMHDSFKLLPMSLKKLSEGFNVEHGKLDLWEAVEERYPNEYKDIVDFLDRCDIDDPLFLEYLGYDVISLYEVLQKLIELSGLSLRDFVKRVSTSSLSRFIFKNGYKGEQFKSPLMTKTDYEIMTSYNWKDDLETEEFLRSSYYGGRVEIFKPRLTKLGYHYDINSLYPSRFDDEYPVGKPSHYYGDNISRNYYEQYKKHHSGYGFMCVSVFIPKQEIPPLPCKMGKLAFPCGHVYGTWSFEELEYAEKHCGVEIKEAYEVVFFSRTFPVFKRFKDTFYQLKEEGSRTGNEALRTLAKLLLNVSYGYTGMTRDKTQLRPFSELYEHENVLWFDKELGYIEVPADINADYIQVQIASAVTSKARLVLLDALRKASENGNVYYCDTDSIVTDEPLPDDIVDPVKLGYFKLETRPLKAVFLRPKVYAEFLEKTEDGEKLTKRFKGVTKDRQKELNYDDYEYLYKELLDISKDSIVIEKNRLTMRSIMYMEKEKIDIDDNRLNDKKNGIKTGYEVRDKKMNLVTVEKRKIDYKNNTTEAWYFESEKAFDDFDFSPPKKEVIFDMTEGGHA